MGIFYSTIVNDKQAGDVAVSALPDTSGPIVCQRALIHKNGGIGGQAKRRLFAPSGSVVWIRKYVWLAMAWGLLALAPCPAFPQPLDHYCLTQIAQRSLYDTPPNNRQPPRLKFSAHGKTYYVEAHGANRLVLLGENNATLSEVLGIPPAYREWYIHPGDIQKLVLGKNGWLWVDSERTDYMVRLDTSTTPPSLGEPVPMPALTYERCGLLRWVVGCGPMGGYGDYSAALDRYFIVGYPQTFLGLFGLSSRVAYEVEAGQTKPLSINMHLGNDTLNADRTSNCIHNFSSGGHIGCEHFIDIPLLHSILYKGDHNEALLYDGTTAPTALD